MKNPVSAVVLLILALISLSFGYTTAPVQSNNFNQQRPSVTEVKAVYLANENVSNEKKIKRLEQILAETSANGIVIDFKDSNTPDLKRLSGLAKRFKEQNVYTIARLVVFQDTLFARRHPETAVKTSAGQFWHSGRAVWKRYWVDPASPVVLAYTIEIAEQAVEAGFDEIQFDYLRFPSDGNMKDMIYPVFDAKNQNKEKVINNFVSKLNRALTSYCPSVKLGIDIFGGVCLNGSEPSIGQDLASMSRYFDVICPMAYPSHYKPGIFGKGDPNFDPYDTYHRTIKRGLALLRQENSSAIIRPWIQDFSLANIYGGEYVHYGPDKVWAQIQASRDLGINGFMLWNAASNFTVKALADIKN